MSLDQSAVYASPDLELDLVDHVSLVSMLAFVARLFSFDYQCFCSLTSSHCLSVQPEVLSFGVLLYVFLPVEMVQLPLKLRYGTRKDACEKPGSKMNVSYLDRKLLEKVWSWHGCLPWILLNQSLPMTRASLAVSWKRCSKVALDQPSSGLPSLQS